MAATTYSQRSSVSGAVVGTYLFIILIFVLLWKAWGLLNEYASAFLILVLLVYLARILSLTYKIRDDTLKASRLFGSRTVPLDSIRRVEAGSLRELAPVSWTGGWGWRSRMWSPVIGYFDNLSTVHQGLVIYGDGVPLFISPVDRDVFLKELDKSCQGRLLTK
jgi:hypothetical protein